MKYSDKQRDLVLKYYTRYSGQVHYPSDVAKELNLETAIVRDICSDLICAGKLVGPE